MRPGALAVLGMLLAAACATAHRPMSWELDHPPGLDAFDRVKRAFVVQYPALEVADPKAFRIRSAWIPFEHGDVPGERRATLYLDPPARLSVVVETRYLGLDLFGTPRWSGERSDPALERELMDAVKSALQ